MNSAAPPFESENLTEQEIAGLRWKAIEAANTMEGISPMARRVLIAMICAMDNRTRAVFTSEFWLAEYLGVNIRSVKAAKSELRDHRILYWTNPLGPRGRSDYQFNWAFLTGRRDLARLLASKAVSDRREAGRARHKSTPMPDFNGGGVTLNPTNIGGRVTTKETINGGGMTTNEQSKSNDETASLVVASSLIGGETDTHWWSNDHSKVVVRPPEQPCITAEREQPSIITHSLSATTTDQQPRDAATAVRQGLAPVAAIPRALEGNGATPAPQRSKAVACHHPSLMRAFGDDSRVVDAIRLLDMEQEGKAAKALAMQGADAAKAIILAGLA